VQPRQPSPNHPHIEQESALCAVQLCTTATVLHHFLGHDPYGCSHQPRNDESVVEVPKNGNEVRDQIERQKGIANRCPKQPPRQPRCPGVGQHQPIKRQLCSKALPNLTWGKPRQLNIPSREANCSSGVGRSICAVMCGCSAAVPIGAVVLF